MGRTKNVSNNLIWGVIEKIVAIFFPFLTRTVLIYTLGIEYVGLSSLFTSVLNVLSLAELGFGSALVFSMYKPIAEENTEKICSMLRFYRTCYHIVGTIILTGGLCILPFLDHLVAGDVPDGVSMTWLFAAYLFDTVVGYFLFAYRSSLFLAMQRVDVVSKINMLVSMILGTLHVGRQILSGNGDTAFSSAGSCERRSLIGATDFPRQKRRCVVGSYIARNPVSRQCERLWHLP